MSATCALASTIEARHQRVGVGIGPHPGRVEVELPAPDQAGLLTEIDDLLEEALEDVDAEPLPDAGQAGVVREVLVQGIAEVPAVGQVEAGRLDELAFGADALEEHDQLQLEEDDRVDGGPASLGIELSHPLPDEAQVELGFQVAVEVVSRERGPPARRRSAHRGGGAWPGRASAGSGTWVDSGKRAVYRSPWRSASPFSTGKGLISLAPRRGVGPV